MIIKEEMTIVFRKNVTCPAGKKIVDMTSAFGPEEALPVKLIIGSSMKNGKWPVYVETEDPANLVGMVTSVTDKSGTDLDDVDISAIAAEGNYNILLKGPQTGTFTGTLQLLKDEASANNKADAEVETEIQSLVDEIVKNGLATKEDMDKRIRVMHDNYVDTFLMKRVLKQYRKYNKPAHAPSCIYVDPYLESSHKRKEEGIIAEGLRAAVGRQSLICEGEKSVGKNVYLETIAWLMGQPQYLITFSRQMSPASIYGEKTTDPSAAKALAAFDETALMNAARVEEKLKFALNLLYKEGKNAADAMDCAMAMLSDEEREALNQKAVFDKLKAQSASVNIVIDASELYDWLSDGGQMVFNELNMADANFLASFTNQLLDGTGFLFVPGRGEVKIHPDCVLFGTQNAEYQGVEMQNEATMSRFGCLYFRQPESIKKQLVAATNSALVKDGFAGASLDAKYYNECEAFYKQCRSAVKKGVVSNACLNIRGFIRALTAVAEGDGYARLKRQVDIHVISTCPVDERAAIYALLENVVTL